MAKVRQYSAFLLRFWHLSSGIERIQVRHIQSGLSITVASLQAATDWINEHQASAPIPDQTTQHTATEHH